MKEKKGRPIHEILSAIDRKDRGYWSRLSDDDKKAFPFWILMRYTSASTSNTPLSIYLTNESVNINYMSITSEHMELLWLLYTVIGEAQPVRREYQPTAKSSKSSNVAQFLLDVNPHLKRDEAELLGNISSREEIRVLAKQYGYSDAEIKQFWK